MKNEKKIYNELAELYPKWRVALNGGPENTQVPFIDSVLKRYSVKTCIDLGGGVGTHSGPLLDLGFEVTNFDGSQKALDIAKKNFPKLETICGSFEDLDLGTSFDAAISMWSTVNYILDPEGREKFYGWLKSHIGKVIIIDQPNFLNYSAEMRGEYRHEDLRIERTWNLTPDHRRETTFIYHLGDQIIQDSETQQFLLVDELFKLLGNDWKLVSTCGDYSVDCPYVQTSHRMITVFEREES